MPRNSGSGRDRHEEKGGMTGEIRKASVQMNWKTFIKFIYPVFLKQIPRSIDKDTNFNCSYINFNIGRLNSACLLESFSGCYFTFFKNGVARKINDE